jgi:VanZ family protein
MLSLLLLWPFDFHLPFSFKKNHVRWIAGTNGVEFAGTGAIHFPSSLNALHGALLSGDGLTVEVWAATKNNQEEGPARIITYSKNPRLRNFTLAQARADLVMRLRTSDSDVNGTDSVLTVKDLFRPNEPQHIAVTYDFSQQKVYVDGAVWLRATLPWGRFSSWDPSYSLVLGNEATGNRPWLGKLFLLAIYNRSLSDHEIRKNYGAGRRFEPVSNVADQRVQSGLLALYPFTERHGNRALDRSGKLPSGDLHIPTRVMIGEREYLSSPYTEFRSEPLTFRRTLDIIANIVFFIPLGLLLRALLTDWCRSPRKGAAWAITLGMLFTITIESLQYFSQTRYSSMTDVIGNVIGTALGATFDIRRRPSAVTAV